MKLTEGSAAVEIVLMIAGAITVALIIQLLR